MWVLNLSSPGGIWGTNFDTGAIFLDRTHVSSLFITSVSIWEMQRKSQSCRHMMLRHGGRSWTFGYSHLSLRFVSVKYWKALSTGCCLNALSDCMNSLRNNFATLEMKLILAGCGCAAFFFSTVEFPQLFQLFHRYLRMVTGGNKASSCFVWTMTLKSSLRFSVKNAAWCRLNSTGEPIYSHSTHCAINIHFSCLFPLNIRRSCQPINQNVNWCF